MKQKLCISRFTQIMLTEEYQQQTWRSQSLNGGAVQEANKKYGRIPTTVRPVVNLDTYT